MIDALLEEQRVLTAVERFSRSHDPAAGPAQAKFYRSLIPLSRPGPGQQFGFEVDLDRCSGCKACVTACHALNGLDEEESWRSVGLLHSAEARGPFQATVTTACHHCVDPGCLSGCPVLAYDKDPETGIVRHLDDQCIGCQYCVMKCPYEVPQYSATRGIVRKCDMCSSRLGQGEAPACVQACPSQAIRIMLVDQAGLVAQLRPPDRRKENSFLPASPRPEITVPTTRYVSARALPANLRSGGADNPTPADGHLPLVFMLVLSQLSVGFLTFSLWLPVSRGGATTGALIGAQALAIGSLHLGQPLKAWRAFLGWRTSWFSREVIVFGAYVPLAFLSAAVAWLPLGETWQPYFAWAAALIGLSAVACSAMLYADTHRKFWRATQSFGKFFGTTLVLGLAAVLAALPRGQSFWAGSLLCASALKLALEQGIVRHWQAGDAGACGELDRSAVLLAGDLGLVARVRLACGIVGGMVLPVGFILGAGASAGTRSGLAWSILAGCLAGELLERSLFFRAVVPDKMPGGFHS